MPLLLLEDDVRGLVDINDALEAVAFAFTELAAGRARNQPRRRVTGSGSTLATMSAYLQTRNLVGYKAYTAGRWGARFWVHLFEASEGRPLAIIEADWLGALRTGAVSGLATRALARPDAQILTVLGAGHQAPTQVGAIAAVRQLAEIRIVNRDPQRRARLLAELAATYPGTRITEPASPAQAIAGADIITTITSSASPLLLGTWIEPGQHLNAAGSNMPDRRELDASAVGRANLVVVDDIEAARLEAGDLLLAEREGALAWDAVHSLAEVLTGSVRRSQSTDVTIFKSVGLAVEDVALAAVVLERAGERGRGRRVAF